MFIEEFFYFPKSDRKVIVFLLVVAVAALAGIYGLGGRETSQGEETDTLAAKEGREDTKTWARPAERERQNGEPSTYYYDAGKARAERFPFDPNTADSTQLLRLGLQPRQVRNIYKFRAKGGVYRHPTDFAQLYGLTAKQYRELEPYIRISKDYQDASLSITRLQHPYKRDTLVYPHKIAEGQQVSLNTADTALLRRIPGIGPYYARRIADYRTRLGGYVSTAQLLEIEGFPEDALPYFDLHDAVVKKIKVNQLTMAQLRRHPYINFFQARAITDFRRLKRPLKGIEDLRLMDVFSDNDIKRLLPYLEF